MAAYVATMGLCLGMIPVHGLPGSGIRAGLGDVFLPPLPMEKAAALRDRTYYFPANAEADGAVTILPLRRWDLIFTGDRLNAGHEDLVDHENINRIIPGPYNHLLVYLGKDARGLAYAAELNADAPDIAGGIRLLCLGSDFGFLRVPGGGHLVDRDRIDRRWAMRFREPERSRILAAGEDILRQLLEDHQSGFPYQLEYRHSGGMLDFEVFLVDDGRTGGAGCSDYWTSLWETRAGICLKGVRISADEASAYFLEDPEGRLAYAPVELSPFPVPVPLHELLNLGFRIIEDDAHVFPCDGLSETGLVLPSLLMANPRLEEIEPLALPWKGGLPGLEMIPR